MRTKNLLTVLALVTQIPGLLSQEIPKAKFERDAVTAGQTLKLKVTFPEALSYAAAVLVYFGFKSNNGAVPRDYPEEIPCNGIGQAGSKDMVLTCHIPIDQLGGTYQVLQFRLGPPPGGSHWRLLQVPIPDFEVLPVEDKNVYPTTAAVSISLDQKQALQNGAIKIDALLDRLNARVEGNAAETKDLKEYLSTTASTAQGELEHIRVQYRKTLPSGKSEPIFFEDFDRQLTAFIVGVSAPKTVDFGEQKSQAVHFMPVQLSSRETVTVHPTPLDGSLGPFASVLVHLLVNLRDAFNTVAQRGTDEFTISLRSVPPGAVVSYKRLGEKYQDYSSPTNVDQATFPYAMWTFRFTINHCDVFKKPNPYVEQSPNLTVLMRDCVKR